MNTLISSYKLLKLKPKNKMTYTFVKKLLLLSGFSIWVPFAAYPHIEDVFASRSINQPPKNIQQDDEMTMIQRNQTLLKTLSYMNIKNLPESDSEFLSNWTKKISQRRKKSNL